MEIERKFLVASLPEGLSDLPSAEIEQSYLDFGDGEEPERRIRRLVKENETVFFYTEKGKGDFSREEEEYEISEYTYLRLGELSVSATVKKVRHYVNLGDGLTAELDIYGGELSGLMTVEVEFPSLDGSKKFVPPAWFGEEITYDAKYRNKNLAKK